MILDLEIVVQLVVIVLTGLTAGLCFTWYNAVTPGIGRLDDLAFLRAFQAMNRSIINPTFMVIFFGPFFGHLLNIYLMRTLPTASLWIFITAAVLFVFGVAFVTIFKNVPLNELLDKTDLLSTSKNDLAKLRSTFETPWNRWHLIRTICSSISFILLLITFLIKD